MNNPWEEISLDDYEKHMRLDTVKQLQAMNAIMKEQFAAYPAETAMILGVAGGNGLEHMTLNNTAHCTEKICDFAAPCTKIITILPICWTMEMMRSII